VAPQRCGIRAGHGVADRGVGQAYSGDDLAAGFMGAMCVAGDVAGRCAAPNLGAPGVMNDLRGQWCGRGSGHGGDVPGAPHGSEQRRAERGCPSARWRYQRVGADPWCWWEGECLPCRGRHSLSRSHHAGGGTGVFVPVGDAVAVTVGVPVLVGFGVCVLVGVSVLVGVLVAGTGAA
jgi:hypothetical protein